MLLQTQCWPCDDGKTCSRDDACVDIAAAQDPFHCLSPLYAYGGADVNTIRCNLLLGVLLCMLSTL